jgi:cobalt-zinc-cadmium efflux system membrane fusion protein
MNACDIRRPPSINNACCHRQPIGLSRLNRDFVALAASLLVALGTPALAQATPANQINLSKEQIQRSGIQTQPALAATSAAATSTATQAPAPGPDSGQRLSGTVVAPANAVAIVSTAVSGIVQEVHVSTLQQVRSDTPVATLFSQQLMEGQREYLHRAIQARLAQEKLARDENLLKEGIISLARMQEPRGAAVQAELAAKERYQSLRAAGMTERAIGKLVASNNLSPQLIVTSGARGTVIELDIHAGQRIDAGMPIARISTGAGLWIDFQASRQQAAQIRLGDFLQLKECGTAKVIAISPHVNAANQSTVVRATPLMSDGCLKPNQFVEASHGGGSIPPGSVGVPAAAIVRNGPDSFVFVRNEQGFEAVKVSVSPGGTDKVWVTGKLAAGSPVAVKGIVALKGSWLGLGVGPGAEVPATVVKPDGKAGGAK